MRRLIDQDGNNAVDESTGIPTPREDFPSPSGAPQDSAPDRPRTVEASQNQLPDQISEIWQRSKPAIMGRIEAIEAATLELISGTLSAELRLQAAGEAHKLVGSLGTFGYPEGSRLARTLEETLLNEKDWTQDTPIVLSDALVSLRKELEKSPRHSKSASTSMATGAIGKSMLIVEDDLPFAQALKAGAESGGFRVEHASDLTTARDILARRPPDVVLLDLTLPGGPDDGLVLMEELSSTEPRLPVFVVTARQQFIDRVDAASLGGRGFFQKPLDPAEIIDTIVETLQEQDTGRSKVLAVDDDPILLDALKDLLQSSDVSVMVLDAPSKLLYAVEEFQPDLVMLDVTMPAVNGIDLCRVLRADSRWNDLPILFLTARTDPETVRSLFEAGADDYVSKPLVGPELVARIMNRLDRVRAIRSMAFSDPVTGLPNRVSFTDKAKSFIRRATSRSQLLSIAAISVDGIPALELDDPEGADAVVRRISQLLRNSFRADDALSHWGGGRFVVGMYGMSREEAIHRVAGVLEALRDERFDVAGFRERKVTFSSGVAQFPEDGQDLIALHKVANRGLNRALQSGGDRVVSASSRQKTRPESQLDVLLVDDDESLAGLLTHALDTRGYTSHWIADGHVAMKSLIGPDAELTARIILLDVNLPGLDGLGLLRRITKEPGLENTRVIMLTARSSEEEVLRALDLGAFDHVAKPFSLQVLMRRVRRALMA